MNNPDFGAKKPDADLVVGAKGGNQKAFDQLFNRWFDKVWNISKSIVNDDDAATKLTEATFLNTWRQLHQLDTPSTFGARVLLDSRKRALDALGDVDVKTSSRQIPRGDPSTVNGDDLPLSADSIGENGFVGDDTYNQHLLWSVTETLGESEASLLDLRLRYGLSSTELAHELDISNKEIQQKIGEQTNQLIEAVRNFFLWNYGHPQCSKLGALIKGSGNYKPSIVRTLKGHHISCGSCKTRRLELQTPAELFSSIPLVDAPEKAKIGVVANLSEDGLAISTGPTSSADDTKSVEAINFLPKFTPEPNPTANTQSDGPLTANDLGIEDTLSDRFPNQAGPKITERFEPVSVDESSGFAHDSPVRYSSRPPRVVPQPEPQRFAPSKVILVSAATLLFFVAIAAVVFNGQDPETVSATAEVTTSSSSTSTTTTLSFSEIKAGEIVLDETTTSVDQRRTTVTTVRPTTSTTTTSTTIAPTTTTQPVKIVVPQLAKTPSAQALQTLTDLGLNPNIVQVETNNRTLVGQVRITVPRAGRSVDIGSNINVQVYVLQ